MVRIDEKIEDYLIRTGSEQGYNTGFTDNHIPIGFQARTDEELFTRAMDFISNLDPESLSDEQLETVDSIFEDLEVVSEEDIEDEEDEEEESLDEIRYARRTKPKRRRIARMYYRRNKSRVRRARKKFKKSSLGRRRMRIAKRMARSGRTATGRRKVHYRR